MPKENTNSYTITKKCLKDAVDHTKISNNVYSILKKPLRSIEVSIPVTLDNGKIETFTGYRCQHLDILGPTKGGIRFHKDVSLDEVKALSIWMSLKCSIMGLPYGGGKGGVVVDTSILSAKELERLSRGYIRAMAPFIGPEKDIPAPDVNTNPKVMGWMLDEFNKIKGYNNPGVITGKPIILGGSEGRFEATGRGVVFTIIDAMKHLNIQIEGARIAIQGFGNVGSMAAKILHDLGCKVIAVSDSKNAIFNEDGLDIPTLIEHKMKTKRILGFKGSEEITNNELLGLEAEVLIPAALSNVLDETTAKSVKAKIVAEAANGPTTLEGDKILNERNIFVIPEILSNAGGVTVSYFEWVQNITGTYWTEEEVNSKLKEKMTKSFSDVYRVVQEENVSMRKAAYIVAVSRLTKALEARGWV